MYVYVFAAIKLVDLIWTKSSGTTYVFNKHEDEGQLGPYTIAPKSMSCCSYPLSLVDQNPNYYRVVMLTTSFNTDYALNDEDESQFNS